MPGSSSIGYRTEAAPRTVASMVSRAGRMCSHLACGTGSITSAQYPHRGEMPVQERTGPTWGFVRSGGVGISPALTAASVRGRTAGWSAPGTEPVGVVGEAARTDPRHVGGIPARPRDPCPHAGSAVRVAPMSKSITVASSLRWSAAARAGAVHSWHVALEQHRWPMGLGLTKKIRISRSAAATSTRLWPAVMRAGADFAEGAVVVMQAAATSAGAGGAGRPASATAHGTPASELPR